MKMKNISHHFQNLKTLSWYVSCTIQNFNKINLKIKCSIFFQFLVGNFLQLNTKINNHFYKKMQNKSNKLQQQLQEIIIFVYYLDEFRTFCLLLYFLVILIFYKNLTFLRSQRFSFLT